MTHHTPGPWRVVKRANQTGTRALSVAMDRNPATPNWLPAKGWNVHLGPLSSEDEANARLIAAAPDLLAACETALANLAPAYASDHLVVKSLRAAIAKAQEDRS